MIFEANINIVNKVLFITTDRLAMSVLSILVFLSVIVFLFKTKKYKLRLIEMGNETEELRELYKNSSVLSKELSEDLLVQKEKNTTLISKLNREINNSVNGIMGMANLLKDTTLTPDQEKNAKAIVACSETLLQNSKSIFDNNYNKTEMDKIKSITGKITQAPAERLSSRPISPEFASEFPLKILIAEDDTINQHLAMRILNKLGYKPDVVSNGKEALEIVSEKNYDVILMDGLMPEMDGFEATRMIRLCLEIQPIIIALTASTMYGDKEKCIQAGMNDYISKPLIIGELAASLERWATEKRAVS